MMTLEAMVSCDLKKDTAITNPDPAGDNYDPFHNPTGTEGNYWHDEESLISIWY